ncbi:MAG: hypothetical protein R3300_08800 [Candidatus Promineifilaceae bacterium]|nr:hypothetical protein [Candidatus Promineifilaceae bacterium]
MSISKVIAVYDNQADLEEATAALAEADFEEDQMTLLNLSHLNDNVEAVGSKPVASTAPSAGTAVQTPLASMVSDEEVELGVEYLEGIGIPEGEAEYVYRAVRRGAQAIYLEDLDEDRAHEASDLLNKGKATRVIEE